MNLYFKSGRTNYIEKIFHICRSGGNRNSKPA